MTSSPVAAVPVSSGTGLVRLVGESLALVVLLAATWVIAGIALQGAGVGVVSAGRTGFAALGLLLLVLLSHRSRRRSDPSDPSDPVRRYAWWQLGALSVAGVAGYTVLSTVAIELAGPTVPSLILALSPVVVLVLESALTRARVRPFVLLATVVAIVGAVLYVAPRMSEASGPSTAWGVLAAVGAMLSMAAYGLLFAHVNTGRGGPMALRILPIFALGSVPLVLWAVVEIGAGERVQLATIGVLALLGLGIYVPAYLVQHRIILSAGPSFAALLGLAVPPLVGGASAAVGLAALPAPPQVVGIVLTLTGMIAVITLKRQCATLNS